MNQGEKPNPGPLAEKLLLEHYSPPCVVVDEKCQEPDVTTRLFGVAFFDRMPRPSAILNHPGQMRENQPLDYSEPVTERGR